MQVQLLKRHPSLQPLSRDNGLGLVCAQRLHKAVRASRSDRVRLAEQLRSVFRDLIDSYLDDELRILSPFIPGPELTTELSRHHGSVRRLVINLVDLKPDEDPGLGLLSRIADALDEYVRWEEHTLFPAIEEALDGKDLEKLTEMTSAVEVSRSRPTQQLHVSVRLDKQSGLAETCGCSTARIA